MALALIGRKSFSARFASPIALAITSIVFLPSNAFAGENDGSGYVCRELVGERTPAGAIVDHVWSGTRVDFDALSAGEAIYVAYYNSQRLVTVAEVNTGRKTTCKTTLPARFEGWDSHNGLVLAKSQDGVLHIAANMHASKLVYGRTQPGGELNTLKLQHSMVGSEEERVTYPAFVSSRDRETFFLYRSGESGNGQWFINRWTGDRWDRVGRVFVSEHERGSVSAYPTPLVQDDEGLFHVAIVWRRTHDIETNFAVTYGRTKDFKTWYAADGKALGSALSVDSGETVDYPGARSGLINNAKLVVLPGGRPVVVFTKHGPEGKEHLYAATPHNKAWTLQDLAHSSRDELLTGGGSVSGAPVFNVSNTGCVVRINYRFADGVQGLQQFEPPMCTDTGGVIDGPKSDMKQPSLSYEHRLGLDRADLQDPISSLLAIRRRDGSGQVGWIFWTTQGVNRDRPRACVHEHPKACNPPPKPLRLMLH